MAEVVLRAVGGRYPFQLTRYEPKKIRAVLTIEGDRVRLRIEDTTNIDRWEEFVIDRPTLAAALQEPA